MGINTFELKKWKVYLRIARNRGLRYSLKKAVSKGFPSLFLRFPGLIMYPTDIMVEPTNICNLKCQLCPHKLMKRKKGSMTFEQFKKFIDSAGVSFKHITFGMMGDPLLNKDIFKMIKYVSERGVKTNMPTNGTFLDRFDMDEIFNSGLTHMNIALDGVTKESYLKYRVGGDYERLLKGVKRLCKAKRKTGAKTPKINLQFLVMKHNEHEMVEMERLARDVIKPDSLNFKTMALWTGMTHKDRAKTAKKWLPKKWGLTRFDNSHKTVGSPKICPFTFDNTVILWNGDVAVCCLDYDGSYVLGNVFEKPFKDIFRSKKYMRIRKKILKKELPICRDCDLTDEEHGGKRIEFGGS